MTNHKSPRPRQLDLLRELRCGSRVPPSRDPTGFNLQFRGKFSRPTDYKTPVPYFAHALSCVYIKNLAFAKKTSVSYPTAAAWFATPWGLVCVSELALNCCCSRSTGIGAPRVPPTLASTAGPPPVLSTVICRRRYRSRAWYITFGLDLPRPSPTVSGLGRHSRKPHRATVPAILRPRHAPTSSEDDASTQPHRTSPHPTPPRPRPRGTNLRPESTYLVGWRESWRSWGEPLWWNARECR